MRESAAETKQCTYPYTLLKRRIKALDIARTFLCMRDGL